MTAMKAIRLRDGSSLLVDDDVFEWAHKMSWARTGSAGYAGTNCKTDSKSWHIVYLHRMIMKPPEGVEIDHINRNPLDNRRCNLRLCIRGQNARNRKNRKGTSSQYKGVSWQKSSGRWIAYIDFDCKRLFLGTFASEVSAAMAYDTAAFKYHREFASPNFSDGLATITINLPNALLQEVDAVAGDPNHSRQETIEQLLREALSLRSSIDSPIQQ